MTTAGCIVGFAPGCVQGRRNDPCLPRSGNPSCPGLSVPASWTAVGRSSLGFPGCCPRSARPDHRGPVGPNRGCHPPFRLQSSPRPARSDQTNPGWSDYRRDDRRQRPRRRNRKHLNVLRRARNCRNGFPFRGGNPRRSHDGSPSYCRGHRWPRPRFSVSPSSRPVRPDLVSSSAAVVSLLAPRDDPWRRDPEVSAGGVTSQERFLVFQNRHRHTTAVTGCRVPNGRSSWNGYHRRCDWSGILQRIFRCRG